MRIEQKFTTKNQCYHNNIKIKVKGLMLHSTGCAQPKASVFFNSFNSSSIQKAVHAFVQADGYVMQTLPWDVKAWHCGGSGNSSYIGVEMTEPSTIKYTGGSSWKDLDPTKTKEFVIGTFNTAAELFAKLCKQYALNPLGKNVIICHQDGAKLGIASNHADVYHIWNHYGLTMDKFRNKVAEYMKSNTTPEPDPAPNPIPTPTKGYLIKVNVGKGDVLNIRKSAAATSTIIGKLQDGFLAYVVGSTGNWLKLHQGGYVSKTYTKVFKNGYTYTPNRYTVTILADSLNVRSTPTTNTNNNIVGSVKKGQKFTVIATCNGFGLLLSGAGNISIDKKYVKLTSI